jgi:leucyl aminopeptidase
LLNQRGSDADPCFIEAHVRTLVEGVDQVKELKVIRGDDLLKENMNLFHAVGRGAASEPRYIAVKYMGNPESDEISYAIVGKGLTFDTGGLNLKPTGFIETMYCDKGGACATLGAMKGVFDTKLPINVIFAIGVADNAIDANSFKPGDIITSRKGLTVEVGNTDAEGRLVLADTLTYTQDKYSPKKIINLATLTGACMVALGEHTAGLFSNNDEFVKELLSSSKKVHESCWQLPLNDFHREGIKGKVANISNTGGSRYGGASTAAAFLEHFIENKTPWIHMDIAGPAHLAAPSPPLPKEGTGFGAMTLLH